MYLVLIFNRAKNELAYTPEHAKKLQQKTTF